MHILYLCQIVPYPPDAGPKVRAYYTLRYLAQKHRVTLLAFSRPDDRPEALEHLRQFCTAVHTVPIRRSKRRDVAQMLSSMLSGRSFIIQRDFVKEMAQWVDRLLEGGDVDAVHADQLWMVQYALRIQNLMAKGLKAKLVLDEHNTCFQIVERLADGEGNLLKKLVLEREWRALRRFEAMALGQFDQVVTVTEEDRRTLQALLAATSRRISDRDLLSAPVIPKFTTIPICVDTEAFRPVSPQPGARDVLHLGTMFWPPNVEGVIWFARQVWPFVQAAVPEARLIIVGKNPPAEVQALSRETSPGDAARSGGVRVIGYVADPQSYLEQAGVFIVPLFAGSGMRVKIVDGWRWGLPVVSTTIGAEGIRYRDGENILIADGPEAFAAAVVRVFDETDLNHRLRENGRRWVEEHYDWQRVYPAWDDVYAG